jgi:hypothetical protein
VNGLIPSRLGSHERVEAETKSYPSAGLDSVPDCLVAEPCRSRLSARQETVLQPGKGFEFLVHATG